MEDVRIHSEPTDAVWRDILAKYETVISGVRNDPLRNCATLGAMGAEAPVGAKPVSKEIWENVAKEFQTVTSTSDKTSDDNSETPSKEISQEFDYEGEIRRIETAEVVLEQKCASYRERQKKISEEMEALRTETKHLDEKLYAIQNETSDLWEANPKVTEFRQLYNDVVGTTHEKLSVSDEVKNAVRKALQKQLPTAMFDTKVRLETAIWGLDHSSKIST